MPVTQSKPWWKGMLMGWMAMIVTGAVGTALVFLGYKQTTLFASAIIGVIFWAVGMLKWRYEAAGLAGIFAIFIGIVLGLASASYARFRLSPVVRDISVAEAPQYPQAGAFYFTDAKVLTEYTYLKVSYGPRIASNPRYKCVAPVVHSAWQKTDPIPAWAVCEEGYDNDCRECIRSFKENHRTALVENTNIDATNVDKSTITAANASFSLNTATNAPVLTWTPDPFGYAKKNFQLFVGLSALLVAIWTGVYFYSFRKSRSKD